jgi:hypothetical protein
MRYKVFGPVVALTLAGGLLAAPPVLATASAAVSQQFLKSTVTATFRGTVNLAQLASQTQPQPSGQAGTSEFRQNDALPKYSALPQTPTGSLPSPQNTPIVAGQLPGFAGFDALNHRDQRLANNGNQFSLEPPDQGLCTNGSVVMEGVNTAEQVYTTAGSPLLAQPVADNQFFLFPPELTRPSPLAAGGPPFGPFLSDPKCYYDADTGRWFHTILEIDTDPATGNFTNHAAEEVAVSATSDPTGDWYVYEFDATDSGHPNCPCFGDQPLIGADANGFYVSTAEYSLGRQGFNGPQVYAFSKAALEAGTGSITGVHFANLNFGTPAGCYQSGTLQPATSPGGVYNTGNGGTEFLMQSHDIIPCNPLGTENPSVIQGLTVWALTGTSALGSDLDLHLTATNLASQSYGAPVPQTQEDGPRPLGDSLHAPNPMPTANDDRLNQVVYAAGKLWSAVNTIVAPGRRDGISWFIVNPRVTNGSVTASMANQGYVAVANAFLSFPSIGVNSAGSGVMTFSLMGPNHFPSAAYASISSAGTEAIHIGGVGRLPDDGFTCYPQFGPTSCRWGDYSAAVASPSGNTIWMAAEYIPNDPRTSLANWGTFVQAVSAP